MWSRPRGWLYIIFSPQCECIIVWAVAVRNDNRGWRGKVPEFSCLKMSQGWLWQRATQGQQRGYDKTTTQKYERYFGETLTLRELRTRLLPSVTHWFLLHLISNGSIQRWKCNIWLLIDFIYADDRLIYVPCQKRNIFNPFMHSGHVSRQQLRCL